MAPGLQWQPQLYGDDKSNEVMGLDLNLPGKQIHPFNCPIYWNSPSSYETINTKRLKLEQPMDESIGSNSNYNCSTSNSLTSLPRLGRTVSCRPPKIFKKFKYALKILKIYI